MQAYCKTDSNGRVTAISTAYHCGEDEQVVEVPDTVDLTADNQMLTVDGGVVVATPLESQPLPITDAERLDQVEQALMELASMVTTSAEEG